jgi:hypothetical protein
VQFFNLERGGDPPKRVSGALGIYEVVAQDPAFMLLAFADTGDLVRESESRMSIGAQMTVGILASTRTGGSERGSSAEV